MLNAESSNCSESIHREIWAPKDENKNFYMFVLVVCLPSWFSNSQKIICPLIFFFHRFSLIRMKDEARSCVTFLSFTEKYPKLLLFILIQPWNVFRMERMLKMLILSFWKLKRSKVQPVSMLKWDWSKSDWGFEA